MYNLKYVATIVKQYMPEVIIPVHKISYSDYHLQAIFKSFEKQFRHKPLFSSPPRIGIDINMLGVGQGRDDSDVLDCSRVVTSTGTQCEIIKAFSIEELMKGS